MLLLLGGLLLGLVATSITPYTLETREEDGILELEEGRGWDNLAEPRWLSRDSGEPEPSGLSGECEVPEPSFSSTQDNVKDNDNRVAEFIPTVKSKAPLLSPKEEGEEHEATCDESTLQEEDLLERTVTRQPSILKSIDPKLAALALTCTVSGCLYLIYPEGTVARWINNHADVLIAGTRQIINRNLAKVASYYFNQLKHRAWDYLGTCFGKCDREKNCVVSKECMDDESELQFRKDKLPYKICDEEGNCLDLAVGKKGKMYAVGEEEEQLSR